jgi:hypothetical protein
MKDRTQGRSRPNVPNVQSPLPATTHYHSRATKISKTWIPHPERNMNHGDLRLPFSIQTPSPSLHSQKRAYVTKERPLFQHTNALTATRDGTAGVIGQRLTLSSLDVLVWEDHRASRLVLAHRCPYNGQIKGGDNTCLDV